MNTLLSLFREMIDLRLSMSDLVDILAVAILIYALFELLRKSRAMQMLWGIAAIALLYLLASWFKLITLSYILSNLLVFLPIAIIVLFQQEIRRMLAAFGSISWIPVGIPHGERPVQLNEVALAASRLASKRIGALIAIERQDSLDAWAETGIPLDSRFSYDLLLNIFIPGTPLHDGAVIIKGDRIVAASCFLPLTTQHALSSELGTRHRAAIGLSEESDALIIVVSEETGTISMAVKGQLLRPLDENTLRDSLAEHLVLFHGRSKATR